MTIQQLKYVLAIADKGSFNEAAKSLYISQPSLSNSIKELEQKIKITIFNRTNRGVAPSLEGLEFIKYARQVMQQYALLEEKYIKHNSEKLRFSVSTQHYSFVSSALIELIKESNLAEYEFTLRETSTIEVIEDVQTLRSEIGIIFLYKENEKVLRELLKSSKLDFIQLFSVEPHVFISRNHPKITRDRISLDELQDYPCLSLEQRVQDPFYLSEEIFNQRKMSKRIKISDRATLYNLLIELDAYAVSTGILMESYLSPDIISIPLEIEGKLTVGAILHKDMLLSKPGRSFMDSLKRMAYKYVKE